MVQVKKNASIPDQFRSALLFEKRKEYKSALKIYRSILEVNQNYVQAWLNSGALYSKLSKPAKAIFCYQQALSSKGTLENKSHIEDIYYNLAVEYFKVKEYYQASQVIQKCIQHNPKYLSAYLMAAMIFDKLSDFKKGQKILEGLLKLSPKHKAGHIAMTLLSVKSKDYKTAAKHLETLEALGEKKGIVYKLKSKLLLETGELNSSIDIFKLMIKEDPELKKLEKVFEEEIPSQRKKVIKKKKNKLEDKKEKNNSEWLDLSLLSLFEGDPEKAMNHLEKVVK